MSSVIAWIAAQADTGEEANQPETAAELEISPRKPVQRVEVGDVVPSMQPGELEGLRAHQFPNTSAPVRNGPGSALLYSTVLDPAPSEAADETGQAVESAAHFPQADGAIYEESAEQIADDDRERRLYRRRTVAMLRRYMKYSIETGRLPSVLGGEFFRAKVTSYSVVTFEDRVIFVYDMEKCLNKLDEFSRQLIARHILQEHDRESTARLLGCNEKTVRRLVPLALDQFSEILLDAGLMEPIDRVAQNGSKKSCQEGERDENELSCCEDSENKF